MWVLSWPNLISCLAAINHPPTRLIAQTGSLTSGSGDKLASELDQTDPPLSVKSSRRRPRRTRVDGDAVSHAVSRANSHAYIHSLIIHRLNHRWTAHLSLSKATSLVLRNLNFITHLIRSAFVSRRLANYERRFCRRSSLPMNAVWRQTGSCCSRYILNHNHDSSS